MWITLALGMNSSNLPVVLSENLQPIARRQSVLLIFWLATCFPCIPSIPMDKSSFSSTMPLPINVVAIGALINSASFLTSSLAPDNMVPPPAKMNGLSASRSILAAFAICLELPFTVGL